ncbi:MAG: MiaB/RimO family radical SAM methylthiotransferase [Planctomycetota bacterium]
MRSVRFVTFGCKANQYDTQVLREALLRRGMTEEQAEADLLVVNTCTVTAEAGRKARQLIRRVVREAPGTAVCVTGCLAESEPDVLRELPGVQWVLGNGEAKRPVQFLRELGHDIDPEELGIPSGITEFQGHTRAFLKIQDGCDQACSFCIIPSVRGRSKSRPLPELQAEVTRLVQAGHVEVVLCGIHIGHWGRDLGLGLPDLLAGLAGLEVPGPDGAPMPWRMRLSSIDATEVCDGTLEWMAARPDRIAPHLHMPLQSGSGEVLRRMNRWYGPEEYLAACERIRAVLPKPALSADILVGFPGETEQHFQESLETCRAAGFCRLHVFPFSARPGTPAYEMADPVDPQDIRDRRMRLSEWAAQGAQDYLRSLEGLEEWVVLEGFAGLAGRYQRVQIDPAWIEGPPPAALRVRLQVREQEVRRGGEIQRKASLWGLPEVLA